MSCFIVFVKLMKVFGRPGNEIDGISGNEKKVYTYNV